MKILYLTTGCFDKGGISRYCRYQISALAQLVGEDNIRVLSVLGRDKEDFESSFSVTWSGKTQTSKLSNKVGMTYMATRLALLWRPELIVSAHINLAPLTTILSKFAQCKAVLNVYGLEIWSGLSSAQKYSLLKIEHVISDCHITKNYILENGLRSLYPTHVIWDCVDTSIFNPKQFSYNIANKYKLADLEDKFVVLTLGRISYGSRHKGFERLIDAFTKASSTNEKMRLVIAGDGNFLVNLKAQAQQCGIEEKVVFTGSIHEDDMAHIYSMASVFSLISERGYGKGEGIPLTPLESMACGVPAIVGNQDGSLEAIFDMRNGWIINPNDTEAHVKLLSSIAGDRALSNDKAQHARAVINEYFNYPVFVEKHRKLLNECIKN